MTVARLSPAFEAYRALWTVAGPLAPLLLKRRASRGKEDPARLQERMGRASAARPAGSVIWLHAVSVGEANAAMLIADRLAEAREDLHLLFTTGTTSAAMVVARRSPDAATHQFAPLDRADCVARFLDHWRPHLAIFTESDLWPNLIDAAARRGVRLVLVNARMSARSQRNWRRTPAFAARLLGAFDLCLAQDDAMAEALRALGARRVETTGNLKHAAPSLPAEGVELERLSAALAGRPTWAAASTHADEERLAGAAHQALRAEFPDLLTIICPRHPERGAAIANELRGLNLSVARRSAGETPDGRTDVYLVDTLGELGIVYRLAQVAFVGGSFAPRGGQNPLEPARLKRPILHGPHVANFDALYATLDAAGGARRVEAPADLAEAVGALLNDPDARARMAAAAFAVAEDGADALNRTMDHVTPLLPPAP